MRIGDQYDRGGSRSFVMRSLDEDYVYSKLLLADDDDDRESNSFLPIASHNKKAKFIRITQKERKQLKISERNIKILNTNCFKD